MHLTDKIQVFNEDCMAVMSRYPDKYFDLAVVDPPYRDENKPTVWMKDNSHDLMYGFGGKPNNEYFTELRRVSNHQIIWGANNYGREFKGFIVWDKGVRGSNRYSWVEIASTDDELSTVSTIVRCQIEDNKIHPTQKPVKLYDWIFDNYAYCKSCKGEGGYYEDVVGDGGSRMWFDCDDCEHKPFKILDTHGGSMSSVISADKNGMEMVCCELDKDYFDKAVERFNRYKQQLTLGL